MSNEHIPPHAIKITGQYSGPVVYFHVWRYCPCDFHILDGPCNNYIWDALGNQGEEDTEEKAIAAARNYVMYGSSYVRTGYGYDYNKQYDKEIKHQWQQYKESR